MKKSKGMKRSIVLMLSLMLAGFLAGCGKEVAEVPEVTEEPVEVVAEGSESISEEASAEEIVSEEDLETISEEVSEEVVAEIETTNFAKLYELELYLKEYAEPKVVVWNNESDVQSILSDGLSYKITEEEALLLYYPIPVKDISCDIEYVKFEGIASKTCDIIINSTGTDMEIPINITYEDGTEGSITVYITKEWE